MPQFPGLVAVAVIPISRCKGVPVADRYTSRFGCPVFLGLFGSANRSGSPTNRLAHGHAGPNGYSITRANAHTVPNARHPANNRAHRLADALANLYISALSRLHTQHIPSTRRTPHCPRTRHHPLPNQRQRLSQHQLQCQRARLRQNQRKPPCQRAHPDQRVHPRPPRSRR